MDSTENNNQELTNIEQVEQFLNKRYCFQYNGITGNVEYASKGWNGFVPMEDKDFNTLWVELTKAKFKFPIGNLRDLLYSANTSYYDPFCEYFATLPEWDGETDYIQMLADGVETHNQEFWSICLKKWLVAMVGCMIEDDVTNHQVLVFSGAQGIGKTTWVNNLVPKELRNYYYSGTINPDNKDTYVHLAECMLINLDELENLNRSQIGSLKEAITKSQIKIRRPFRRNPEVLTRRASFAGSVNGSKFLNDPTGTRRFLCFEATKFDRASTVPLEGVYSQAYALFKSGFKYYFDEEDNAQIQENNKQFEQVLQEEEWIMEVVTHCEPESENCEYLNASEIAKVIETTSGLKLDQRNVNNIGKAMAKNQFRTSKKDGIKKYIVKRINKGSQAGNGNNFQGPFLQAG